MVDTDHDRKRIRRTQLCRHLCFSESPLVHDRYSLPRCNRQECWFAHLLQDLEWPHQLNPPNLAQVHIYLGQTYEKSEMNRTLQSCLQLEPAHLHPFWAQMYAWYKIYAEDDSRVLCTMPDFGHREYELEHVRLYGHPPARNPDLERALDLRWERFMARQLAGLYGQPILDGRTLLTIPDRPVVTEDDAAL